jgi:hypothetical protein
VQNHLVALTQEKQTLTLEKVRSGRAPGESENQSKTNQEKT